MKKRMVYSVGDKVDAVVLFSLQKNFPLWPGEEENMGWKNFYRDVLPIIAIVANVCSVVGTNTLFKAASSEGLRYYVFILYMKPNLPSCRFAIFWRICLLGLLCFLAVMSALKGIEYSSPTLASAMSNLTPACTFIIAIIFRMEKLALRSSSFQAKFFGTVVSISGALVVVFYQGPTILSIQSTKAINSLLWSPESSQSNWVIGGLWMFFECLFLSLWYIIMTDVMKMYPAELIAFLGPAFLNIVSTWCLRLKGPVYVALFNPLSIVVAAIMSFIFLGDSLHLGSVIGGLILSIGVYAGIWGTAKEEKMAHECCCSSLGSTDERIPLLQSENFEGM